MLSDQLLLQTHPWVLDSAHVECKTPAKFKEFRCLGHELEMHNRKECFCFRENVSIKDSTFDSMGCNQVPHILVQILILKVIALIYNEIFM